MEGTLVRQWQGLFTSTIKTGVMKYGKWSWNTVVKVDRMKVTLCINRFVWRDVLGLTELQLYFMYFVFSNNTCEKSSTWWWIFVYLTDDTVGHLQRMVPHLILITNNNVFVSMVISKEAKMLAIFCVLKF